MKRSGFQKPTGAKLEAALRRQRENREASAKRREERLRKQRDYPGAGKFRQTAIPRENRARRKRLDAEQFGEEAKVIRRMPCCACAPALYREDRPLPEPGERKISQASHTKTRGSGGKRHQQVPHCLVHHDLFEGWGKTRNDRHEEEFGVHAGRLAARIHSEHGGGQ